MLTTVVALVIIDKVGPQKLVYFGVSGMIPLLLAIGWYFTFGAGMSSIFLLVFFLLYIFFCAISIPAPRFSYCSPMYPTKVRGLAMCPSRGFHSGSGPTSSASSPLGCWRPAACRTLFLLFAVVLRPPTSSSSASSSPKPRAKPSNRSSNTGRRKPENRRICWESEYYRAACAAALFAGCGTSPLRPADHRGGAREHNRQHHRRPHGLSAYCSSRRPVARGHARTATGRQRRRRQPPPSGGFFGEFCDSLAAVTEIRQPPRTGWVNNVLFEPSVGNAILGTPPAKSLKIALRHPPARLAEDKPELAAQRWRRAATPSRSAREVLIDATELGDVAALAGVGYDIGMWTPARGGGGGHRSTKRRTTSCRT